MLAVMDAVAEARAFAVAAHGDQRYGGDPYVAHLDADLYQNRVVLFGDINMFTDREKDNKFSPTELDWIVGLAFRWSDRYEFSVYREQDRPLDRPGLIQEYWAVQLRFAFDVPKLRFEQEPKAKSSF